MPMIPNRPESAATDVTELLGDIDAGQLAVVISQMVSQTAVGVCNNPKKTGEFSLNWKFKAVPGTDSQVLLEYTVKHTKPTEEGKKAEEFTRNATLFVGKFGALSISPHNQLKIDFGEKPSTTVQSQ